jgi:galactokinase
VIVVSQATDPSRRALTHAAQAGFQARFAVAPRVVAIAPGRVNIIGEHVDYCGGVVLPFAINRCCVAATAFSDGHRESTKPWRIAALDLDEVWEAPANAALRDLASDRFAPGSWQAYVVGVLALAQDALAARGITLKPISMAITSNVPRGSGLSSSAALTVSVAKAVEGLVGVPITREPLDLARLCQRAENQFAGVPCGLMDHAASVLGQSGRAVVLSCRTPESARHVPLPVDLVWLVVDSGVSRSLASGNYAALREACDGAARVLGVDWLYDAAEEELDAIAQKLSVPARRAATHAISERQRVVRTLSACERGDIDTIKRELNAAHASLRDVLEVSCPELDAIVQAAQQQGAGARLVGAGFGGCVLIAIEAARADEVAAGVTHDFAREFGRACPVWPVSPSDGASVMDASA